MDNKNLKQIHEEFKDVIRHPEAFLQIQNEIAQKIKEKLLEPIYSYSRTIVSRQKSKALEKLIIDGMDDESIWQQLEIQNDENLQGNIKNVSRFLASNTDKFKVDLTNNLNTDQESGIEDHEETLEDDSNDDSEMNEESEVNEDDESGNDTDENESDEEDEEEDSPKIKKKKNMRKSVVDDKFFKLSEMEEFLQIEEELEKNPNLNDEDGIDFFEANETNREESLRYSDFFEDENDNNEGEREEERDEPAAASDQPKSSHELKQERLKKKIDHMENSMLDERPWQMKGEVKADNRPQNSLLEEILEFDSTTRAAPIITEEVTLKLEDIIRQRIKDKAFDDVERKVKPSDIQMEYKKQIVLNQEKSKESLAKIYEKEFIQELDKINPDEEEPEEPKSHKELRSKLKDLFEKLDLLSNFYYTPRPAQPELKIITNIPTIEMEEATPTVVSNVTLLAPEEIKRKAKGDMKGADERTKTDKNRERRHKKIIQQNKFKKQPTDSKTTMKKVTKARNVEKMLTTETTKSSSDFFTKLQDNLSLNKSGKRERNSETEKKNHQAKKFKL